MEWYKEECIKRLKEARYTIQPYAYVNEALDFAIKELSNPPLKFEELKENMWVWDNKHKVYNKIGIISTFYGTGEIISFVYLNEATQWGDVFKFEENRFYRYEVEEDEN